VRAKGFVEEVVEVIEWLVVPNRRHVVDASKVARLSLKVLWHASVRDRVYTCLLPRTITCVEQYYIREILFTVTTNT
jgi:hypothetical protein